MSGAFTKLKKITSGGREKTPVDSAIKKHRPGFGRPATTVVMMLALFFGGQVLAGLIIGFWAIGLGVDSSQIGSWITDRPYAQFFYILLAEGIAVGLLLAWLNLRGLGLADIGVKRPKKGWLGVAALGFLAYYALLFGVILVLQAVLPGIFTDQEQDVGFEKILPGGEYYAAFAALVILPPLGEEILVRGYLFTGLRSKLSFVWTALLTSGLFAAAHLQLGNGEAVLWAAGVNTFVLSLVLCYMRERTGTIWAGVIVHALNNFIAFNVRF